MPALADPEKVSVMESGESAIGIVGRFDSGVVSKPLLLPAKGATGRVSPALLNKKNPFRQRPLGPKPLRRLFVARVLAVGGEPQVGKAIIQSVPVCVVYHHSGREGSAFQREDDAGNFPVSQPSGPNKSNPKMLDAFFGAIPEVPGFASRKTRVKVFPSRNGSEVTSGSLSPFQRSCVSVVNKRLAQKRDIGQGVCSHGAGNVSAMIRRGVALSRSLRRIVRPNVSAFN